MAGENDPLGLLTQRQDDPLGLRQPQQNDPLGIAGGGVISRMAKPKELDRNAFATVNDTMIEGGNAAAGLVKAGVDLFAPGSAASQSIEGFIKSGQEKQSDWKKDQRARLQQDLQSADGEIGKAGQYLKHAIVEDPLGTFGQLVGNVGPFGAVGKATQGLSEGARLATSMGVAGGVTAGEVRGNIFEKINATPDAALMQQSPEYAELRKTMGEVEAKRAIGADFYRNLPEIGTAGLIGMLGGKYGLEGMAAKVAPGYGRIGGAVVGVADEATQGAVEQLASNYGVQRAIPEQGMWEDVALNAAAEGILGVGGALVASPREQAPIKPPGLIERAALRAQPMAAPVDEGGNVATPDPSVPAMDATQLNEALRTRFDTLAEQLATAPETVTAEEQAELQFLTENAANPEALAEAYGVQLAAEQAPSPDLASQIPADIGIPASSAEAADPAIAEQQRLIDELNTRLPPAQEPVQEQVEQPKFSRDNPLDDGAHNAATSPMNDLAEPTQAQKEAGNYAKGRAKVAGLDVSIENPQGSVRASAPDAAEPWQTTMQDHYGYFKGVPARAPDNAPVDTFIKAGTAEDHDGDVFIVNQNNKDGKFDEPKVMMGYDSIEEAQAAYMRNYTPGWQGMGDIVQVPMADFKSMLQDEKAFMSPVKPVESPIPYEAPRFLRDTYKVAKETVEYSPLPLPPQSKALEKNAHAIIDREGDALVDRYIERFGNVVDPDQAKMMFSEFELKPELAAAFHEPSSRLSKMVYAKLLATRPGKTVLFSAGGGGSGKSVALEVIAKNDADIADSTTFDGTLASYKSSKAKIDTALDAGAPVRIIYTNREVGKAFEGAMGRSRVVPIDAIIDAHVGAAQTIRRLAKEYAGNPNVEIEVINNNGSTIEEVARGKLDDIPAYSYDEVKGRLYEQAKRALAEGRIDQRKYEILVRGSTRGGAGKGQAAEQGQVTGPVGDRAGAEAAQQEVDAPKFARADKKPSFQRITETGHRREGSTGRYVGAPDWIGNSPVQLGLLRKKLRQLTLEGESGRYWYEKSSKAVMDLVGGDKVDAEKFVGLLAIYSQGTEVSINLGFALEAYYQWKAGLPIDTGRFPTEQTKKADAWLKDGKDWGGIKTNNFYADLMEEIDPAKVDEGHATMDMWMAIAFDYGMKVLDQGPKYNFAKRETARLAKELGWKPHQVQAAVWTAIKARTEASAPERNAHELKVGIAQKNGNAHAIIKGKEYEHFRAAHKFAMDKQITAKEIADRGVDFADALKARAVQMSWEATPGVTTGVLPGIHNATTAQLSEYLVAVDKALHGEDGRDLIAELINLHNPPTLLGFSAWQGKIGAGAQSFFPVPVTGQGKGRAVLPVARDLLNKYAALKGYILSQEAVVWHHAVHGDAKSRNNGFDLATQRPLTEDEMRTLYDAARTYFSTDELAPAYTANGARILNFVDGLEQKDFQKGMTKIYESLPEGFGGGIVDAGFFRSDGDYISNDWKENPNGEAYVATFAAGSPDLLGRADDLRAMVAQVNQDFSDRYGWGKPSFSRSDAAGDRRAGETNDGASYGEAREGSVQVDGVHYSVARRAVLDGAKYGTGMRGAESARLDAWSATPEQRKRIHFYVDEGSGIRPESGVGSVPHTVRLNNVYDSAKDPLGLWSAARAKSAMPIDIANHFEQAVMAAGFDGYYESNVINGQGVAVLLGDHKVSTAQPKMSRAEGKTGNVATPADAKASKAISVLNTGMARYLKDTAWENAYAPGELHDTLSAIGEALEVGFGVRVIPIHPTAKRFDVFNGVHFAGNIYVNTQADVGFANIAGHELFHELKRKRPDLFQWFAEQSRQYYKDFDAYQKKLNSLLQDGEATIDQAAAEEELLSDFAGDSLADPKFLQGLADASPTKFRQLLMAVRAWIDGAIAKLKGNKSERYVTDLQAMRDNLSKALVAFAEGKPIAADGAPVTLTAYRGERPGGNNTSIQRNGIGTYYSSNKDNAKLYTLDPYTQEQTGKVTRSEVVLRKPYRHDGHILPQNATREEAQALTDSLVAQGYDGIIVDHGAGMEEYVVFANQADAKFSQRSSGEFFSPLQRAFQNAKMQTMTGTGWSQWLKSNMAKVGVKKDEVTWSGINEYLELRGKDKISKEEVAGFIEQNGVSLDERVLGTGKRAAQLAPDDYERVKEIIRRNDYLGFDTAREATNAYLEAPSNYDMPDEDRAELDRLLGSADGGGPSKFHKYVPDGGIPGTYREILVTLPVGNQIDYEKAAEFGYTRKDIDSNTNLRAHLMERFGTGPVFKSDHWKKTPNVLVHLRVDEVKGDGNKRLMRVIEVQSDWGQQGKTVGFKPPSGHLAKVLQEQLDRAAITEMPDLQKVALVLSDGRRFVARTREGVIDAARRALLTKEQPGAPAAPFVTDTRAWVSLGIKRAIQQAVSTDGIEGIVFATGQENADLYDLSKQVEAVYVKRTADGFDIGAMTEEGITEIGNGIPESGLAGAIGKELAQKAIDQKVGVEVKYEGVDLKVGGEGMRAFYDQIVPSVAKDVLRQLGMPTTLVGRTQLPGDPRATATTTGGKWGVSTKDGYVDGNRFDTQAEAREAAAEYNRTHGRVMIDLTPALISTVNRDGIPLFSRANKQPYDIPEDTKLEASRRQVQDKFLRFQTIQEAIELTTAQDAGYKGKDIHAARQYMLDHGIQNPITDATDVYQAETLSSSRIAARKQDFREDRIEPLLKKTAKAGVTMDEIADYLLASHAKEANARIRTIRKDPQATAFGLSDQDAATALQDFQARQNFAEIDALANEWRQITEDTKAMLVAGGIISQDMANAWDATYSHYVPLKGVENQQGAGKGLSVNGKQKRRMGHGSREEAVIANILRDYERAVTQVERNKVGMTLVRFALEISDDNIITLDRPVKRPVFKDGKAYEVLYHGSTVGVFSSDKDAKQFIALDTVRSSRTPNDYSVNVSTDPHVVMQASPMLADNEVNVYVAGQVVRVQINDELAARAYTNMGVEGVNKILSGAREFNTWLSKAYTGYNPEFLLRNLFRDAIQGTVTLTGKFGAGTMAKIYANYPAAMKELAKHYSRHGSSQIVREARADGMQIGSSYLSDIERIGDDVMTAYNEYAGMANTYQRVYAEQIAMGSSKQKAQAVATMRSGIAGAKRVPIIGHFLSIMEHLNAVVENSLRLATYRTLRDMGYSRQQAAAAGKNLMNFNRKGEKSNQAGALYLFFNPNLQGTHVMLQALTSSKYKRQAQALTGMMALAAFALAEMGRGGDDDDEEKWKNIPSHVRDRNMVFMVGDKQITIPVPYGFGVFHSLGNAVSDFVHGESGWKLGLRMMSAFSGNFSPFGNPLANDKLSAFQLLPTIPKMALGPDQNENSFGAPLMPIKYSDAKPDSQNMYRSTKGTVYSALAEGMNELTGGSKYQKGLVDVSPETLRFWVSSLTGGTGRFMVDSLNLGSVVTQGATPELREIPMARVLVREESINDVRRAYWDRVNEAGQAAEEFAAAKRAHDSMAMREIMDDNRTLIRLAKYSERQQKLIKAKRDLVDRIRQDETLSLTQKRDKIKQVEAAEEKIYNKFISAFDDAKGE